MATLHFVLIFATLLYISPSFGQDEVELGPIPYSVSLNSYLPISTVVITNQCRGVPDGIVCRDCDTAVKCKDGAEFFTLKCADQDATRPFCSDRIRNCVNHKNDCNDDTTKSDFVCPGTGLYPDISDCKKFFECTSTNAIGRSFSCIVNSVYDHVNAQCRTGARCIAPVAECVNKQKVIPYSCTAQNLYIICNQDGKNLLKDCGSRNVKFNTGTFECEYVCTQEGRFVDPVDNGKFYVCTANGRGAWISTHETCIYPAKFDPIKKSCII